MSFLDEATDGLHKGEVWVVAGKSGSGKTTLALQIANSFAENTEHSILFLTLEMKGWELSTRLFCQMTGIHYDQLLIGNYPKEFKEQDEAFQNYLVNIDFEVFEYGYTFESVEKIIRDAYAAKKPDVLFIDYIQLIEWRRFGDERVAIAEYIRKLKELAKTLDVGIVVVSQLRRLPSGTNYDREPDIIDLKGSGSLEQTADRIILIYGIEENDEIKWYINLAKNRQGKTIKREVLRQGWIYRFVEIERSREEQATEKEIRGTFM